MQCSAVWSSVLQCLAACCSVLQRVAVSCFVLQCVAVCCSVETRVHSKKIETVPSDFWFWLHFTVCIHFIANFWLFVCSKLCGSFLGLHLNILYIVSVTLYRLWGGYD